MQKVGYKITNLADQSAITVHNFKRASKDVLQELQGTYQYLLDGLEEMALETLSLLTDVAKEMATAAEKLRDDLEKATNDVIDALQDTQRAKGTQEEKKKAFQKERKNLKGKNRKHKSYRRVCTKLNKRRMLFSTRLKKERTKRWTSRAACSQNWQRV